MVSHFYSALSNGKHLQAEFHSYRSGDNKSTIFVIIVANSVYPDETPRLLHLIRVYTVFSTEIFLLVNHWNRVMASQ